MVAQGTAPWLPAREAQTIWQCTFTASWHGSVREWPVLGGVWVAPPPRPHCLGASAGADACFACAARWQAPMPSIVWERFMKGRRRAPPTCRANSGDPLAHKLACPLNALMPDQPKQWTGGRKASCYTYIHTQKVCGPCFESVGPLNTILRLLALPPRLPAKQ